MLHNCKFPSLYCHLVLVVKVDSSFACVNSFSNVIVIDAGTMIVFSGNLASSALIALLQEIFTVGRFLENVKRALRSLSRLPRCLRWIL